MANTINDAWASIRSVLTANQPSGATALRWPNEDASLPDTPAAFIYSELRTQKGFLAGFGGGRLLNLWRTPARLDCYAFVPRGDGLELALSLAESVAALFRSYRDSAISCFDATVYPLGSGAGLKPPGLNNEVDNYYCAVAEISLHFDQVG